MLTNAGIDHHRAAGLWSVIAVVTELQRVHFSNWNYKS